MKPSSIEITVRVGRATGTSYERYRVQVSAIAYLHERPGGGCTIGLLGGGMPTLSCQENYDVVNALLGYRH